MTEQPNSSRRWRAVLKWAVRVLIVGLVAWGIWHSVQKARAELAQQDFSLTQVNLVWLALAGAIYLVGTLPCWVFWQWTLQAMGQRPRWIGTLRAYFVGGLGKYVPGKAMVVVLRTGMLRAEGVDTTIAAMSVFVETLTMMAVGAMVATLLLISRGVANPGLQALSVTIGVVALIAGVLAIVAVPLVLPVLRRIVWLLQMQRSSGHGKLSSQPDIESAVAGLNWRLLLGGWGLQAVGWVLLGGSLWATLRSMPSQLFPDAAAINDLPLLTACVGLAVVAGFASLLPGGIGAREFVVMTLLAEPFGPTAAVVSAVLLRLEWLAAELVLGGILYVAIRPAKERETNLT